MKNQRINRKEFFVSTSKICLGACLCTLGWKKLLAQESTETDPGSKSTARAIKRMAFADTWIKRFMDVLDKTLDEKMRKNVMMTNGKVCFQEWIKSKGQKIKPKSFEKWAAQVKKRKDKNSVRIEGNVIYFEYTSSAETGKSSPEGICLCPMVESKPAGLSSTYCLCSLGYVKEMNEQTFGRRVEVELLDSVLKGGKRCRFKVTVLSSFLRP